METPPITQLLKRAAEGSREASEALYDAVYGELRRRAAQVAGGDGGALQPTVIVHETWLRLADGPETDWQSRDHFLGFAAKAMRSILVDHVRAGRTRKRDGGERVALDEAVQSYVSRAIDLVALDQAMERLEAIDPQLAQIVELRFFGGLTIAETARVLRVSTPTVERGWRTARNWLRTEIGDDDRV